MYRKKQDRKKPEPKKNDRAITRTLETILYFENAVRKLERFFSTSDLECFYVVSRKIKSTPLERLMNESSFDESIVTEYAQTFDAFLSKLTTDSVKTIVDKMLDRLTDKEMCFQGGFGHAIHCFSSESYLIPYYKIKPPSYIFPCHWCARPEFYDRVKLTPLEETVNIFLGLNVEVSPTPRSEIWGN